MSDPVRVGIVGSREWPDVTAARCRVERFVRSLARKYPHAVVMSGGARGVDSWAAEEANRCELATVKFTVVKRDDRTYGHHVAFHRVTDMKLRAEWEDWCDGEYVTFRDAAFARNTWIVKASTQVVAFWNETSNGTRNSIFEARRLNVPYWVNP